MIKSTHTIQAKLVTRKRQNSKHIDATCVNNDEKPFCDSMQICSV